MDRRGARTVCGRAVNPGGRREVKAAGRRAARAALGRGMNQARGDANRARVSPIGVRPRIGLLPEANGETQRCRLAVRPLRANDAIPLCHLVEPRAVNGAIRHCHPARPRHAANGGSPHCPLAGPAPPEANGGTPHFHRPKPRGAPIGPVETAARSR